MTKGDAPKTSSARKPPPTSFLFNKHALDEEQKQSQPKRGIDPRFNPHVYHGNAVKQNVEAQYSFLGELAGEQFQKNLARMKALRKEQRIRAREERERQRKLDAKNARRHGGSSSTSKKQQAEQTHDDDHQQDQDEDEEEEEEEEDFHDELDEEDRIKIGLMRDWELEKEMEKLRQDINKYKMQQGEKNAAQRKSEARKKWAKSQLSAVKAGKQRNAFFLNNKQMKINETKEQLQKMKKSGSAAVNSFVEKKLKKRFDMKHLRR